MTATAKYINRLHITTWIVLIFIIISQCCLAQNNSLYDCYMDVKEQINNISESNCCIQKRARIRKIYKQKRENNVLPDSLLLELNQLKNDLDSVSKVLFYAEYNAIENMFNINLKLLLNNSVSDTLRNDSILQYIIPNPYKEWDKGSFIHFVKINSDRIFPYCWNYKNSINQRKMLTFLNISDSLKNELLSNFEWEKLSTKARLGDVNAEDSLIRCFREAIERFDKYPHITSECYDLLLACTHRCTNAYISAFDCNKICFNKRYYDNCSALNNLIYYFRYFYPNVYMFSSYKQYINEDCLTFRYDEYRTYEPEQKYLREIEEYCKKEYGIELHIDIPFLRIDKNAWWYETEEE